jgi:hypothetical protein
MIEIWLKILKSLRKLASSISFYFGYSIDFLIISSVFLKIFLILSDSNYLDFEIN